MPNDMNSVIVPKSDQINADDLIGGDLTIRITAVSVTPGQEQPVSMKFEGSTKVFRPCKSMARVMVAAWGPDSSAYIGRSLQLYRDPSVKWGGMDVGGIRIRKMTNIDTAMTMALTATKGSRKPYTVHPLVVQAAKDGTATAMAADQALTIAKREAAKGSDHFRAWYNTGEGKDARATGALTPEAMIEMRTIASGADALTARMEDDPFPETKTATDAEIERKILADLAERDAVLARE